MNWAIERLGSTPSTMDEARQRARAGAPDGTVVVAEEMTAGRGTKGRAWSAPKGGLYLSFVLRGLPDAQLLSLALGNAVCDTLEVAGVEPRLKWVNDVLVNGKKVAGILVEAESIGPVVDFIVAGIGLNVNGHAAQLGEAAATATTLEDQLECDSCVPDVEALLLQSISRWVQKLRDGQGAEVVAAFRVRDALLGHQVQVTDGTQLVHGKAEGIDAQGRLLLQVEGTTRPFATGSVRLA